MTATLATEDAQSNVRMTPSAVKALRELARPQGESVARAIAAIGQTEGKLVAVPPGSVNGREYLAMVPDDDEAPVVMYRQANGNAYLVIALVDRAAYTTYEIAERPGFLQSSTFKTAAAAVVAAAIGVILGSRARGGSAVQQACPLLLFSFHLSERTLTPAVPWRRNFTRRADGKFC